MNWITVESKAFAAFRRNAENSTIDIKFPANKSGGHSCYRYSNVSDEVYQRFLAAPSQGSFVIQEFVKKTTVFPFERLPSEVAND